MTNTALILCSALGFAGCGVASNPPRPDLAMGGADQAMPPGPDLAMAAVPAGTIQGTVRRAMGLTFSGDGKGDLWIDIGPECPYPQPGPNFSVAKSQTYPNADLTPADAAIPFTMSGVAAGTWAVWGWVDDNADGNPFPLGGDPGNFPTCPTVTLTAMAGASVELQFAGSTWN